LGALEHEQGKTGKHVAEFVISEKSEELWSNQEGLCSEEPGLD
jgi:hypothetical protein